MRTEQGLGAANAEALNGCSLGRQNPFNIAAEGSPSKQPSQKQPRETHVQAKRGVTAAELQAKLFDPVDWILPGYVAKGLTILAGKPKVGKSWLVLDIALGVATGSFVLGNRKCKNGTVLYAALEDTLGRLKDRLIRIQGRDDPGPWPETLTFWTHGDMATLDAGGLDQLSQWIDRNPDARLIVIDTFAVVRSGPRRGETVYGADYREVGALKRLADEAGVAIILVTHARKMAAEDPWDTVSGTLAITGAADTTLLLTRDKHGVILRARGRDVAEIETAVELNPENFRWRELGDAWGVRRSEARKHLLEAFVRAGEPMSPRALADETGQPGVNVRKLLTKMVKAGEVLKVGEGKYGLPPIRPDHSGHSGHNQADSVTAVIEVTAPARRRKSQRPSGAPESRSTPPAQRVRS
jgi:hypothetical protein